MYKHKVKTTSSRPRQPVASPDSEAHEQDLIVSPKPSWMIGNKSAALYGIDGRVPQNKIKSSPTEQSTVIPTDKKWASWEKIMQGDHDSLKLVHTLNTGHTDSELLNKSANSLLPTWRMISSSLVDLSTWNGDRITYGEILFVLKGLPSNLIKTAAEDIVFRNHDSEEFKKLTELDILEPNQIQVGSQSAGRKTFRGAAGIYSTTQLLETTARNSREQMTGYGSGKKYNEVIVTGQGGFDIHKNGILSTPLEVSEIIILPDPKESVKWNGSPPAGLKGKLNKYVDRVKNANPGLKLTYNWPEPPPKTVEEFRF